MVCVSNSMQTMKILVEVRYVTEDTSMTKSLPNNSVQCNTRTPFYYFVEQQAQLLTTNQGTIKTNKHVYFLDICLIIMCQTIELLVQVTYVTVDTFVTKYLPMNIVQCHTLTLFYFGSEFKVILFK
jgi:hypothetical protein